MSSEASNKRIAKNTMALYIRMGITMLISLYTSRVVLNVLGIDDFGIYSLVGGVIVLFTFISESLNGAVQRFLTFELGKKEDGRFNLVFNVSLTALFVLSMVVLVLFETVGVWMLNSKLVIDPSRLYAAKVVFQLSMLSFIVKMTTAPYLAAIISHEKMSIYAFAGIFETVLKLIIVFLIPVLPYDNLIIYGFLVLLSTFVVQMIIVVYCIRTIKDVAFRFLFEKKLFKQMVSFSGWNIFGSISNTMSREGINVVFNIFHGTALNAAFGLSSQVSTAVFQFVSNFQIAFSPQITKLYAGGHSDELYKLIYRSSKLSYFLLFIILIPFAISVDNVLLLWLKIPPVYTSEFCMIILAVMLLDSISGPLWMLISASGQIKKYQILLSVLSAVNLALVYLLLSLGLSPVMSLLSRLVMSLLMFFLRIFILKEKVSFQFMPFAINVMRPIVMVTILCLSVGWLIYSLEIENTFLSILSKTALSLTVSIPIIYFGGLNKDEKAFLRNIVLNKILKRKET